MGDKSELSELFQRSLSPLNTALREIDVLKTIRDNAKSLSTQDIQQFAWLDRALILRDHIRYLEAEVERLRDDSRNYWKLEANKAEAQTTALKARLEKVRGLIEEYGEINGAHHKQWLLTEIVKLLVPDFERWKVDMMAGEDGPNTYCEWDEGIAP